MNKNVTIVLDGQAGSCGKGKIRRVLEMNWDRLIYNVMINNPSQIALNFAQYIDWNAYRCNNYNDLPKK